MIHLKFYNVEMEILGNPRYDHRLSYYLKWDGRTIFVGDDYWPGGMDNQLMMLGDLIGWLTLKQEDTDIERVENYTAAELAWVNSMDAMELSSLGLDLEMDEYEPSDWDEGIVITVS